MMTADSLYSSLTSRFTGKPPVEDMYSAIGIVSDYLSTRLFLNGSKLLNEEVSLRYASGVNSAGLPDNMLGTVEPPFVLNIIGQTGGIDLLPLPSGYRSSFVGVTGTPEYYEIKGADLFVYPTPNKASTVVFEASLAAIKPTTGTDLIPFNGLFDYIFREVVLLVMLQGGSAVMQADAYLSKTFDAIDRNRANRTVIPRYFP